MAERTVRETRCAEEAAVPLIVSGSDGAYGVTTHISETGQERQPVGHAEDAAKVALEFSGRRRVVGEGREFRLDAAGIGAPGVGEVSTEPHGAEQ